MFLKAFEATCGVILAIGFWTMIGLILIAIFKLIDSREN